MPTNNISNYLLFQLVAVHGETLQCIGMFMDLIAINQFDKW